MTGVLAIEPVRKTRDQEHSSNREGKKSRTLTASEATTRLGDQRHGERRAAVRKVDARPEAYRGERSTAGANLT